jgi:glycosyltransferase involved in cell wall biosynthesis
MKVLAGVPWDFDLDISGLSKRLLGQFSSVAALGHEVDLYAQGEGFAKGGLRVHRLGAAVDGGGSPLSRVENSMAFARGFSEVVKGGGYDALHCFNTTSLYIKEKRLLQMLNPTSSFVKEMVAPEFPEGEKYRRKLEEYDAAISIEREECSRAEVVVASSELSRENLVSRYGVRRADIEVVPTGIDPANCRLDYEKGREGLRIVLFPNRIAVMKGFRYAAEAMLRVKKEFPSAVLMAAGRVDEFDRELLEGSLRALKEAKALTLTGYVSNGKLADYYAMAEVILVPSLADDSSLSALDAAAMSTPLVATRNCGFMDVGEVGVEVPPKSADAIADAVIALLSDERLYRKKRQGAKKVLPKYHWPAIAQRLMGAYDKIFG